MDNVVLVLKVKPWQFTDENTGEVKKGIKVSYVDKNVKNEDEYNGYGFPLFESSVEEGTDVSTVPGLYNASFTTFVNKGNRCTKLSSLEFVQGASLWA